MSLKPPIHPVTTGKWCQLCCCGYPSHRVNAREKEGEEEKEPGLCWDSPCSDPLSQTQQAQCAGTSRTNRCQVGRGLQEDKAGRGTCRCFCFQTGGTGRSKAVRLLTAAAAAAAVEIPG